MTGKRGVDTFTLVVTIASAAGARSAPPRAQRAPCGNFSGVYDTHYGLLRFTRTGDQVRGSYTTGEGIKGTVSGTVRGNVLAGRWTEPSSKGRFRFMLDPDGRSFTGSFSLDADPNEASEWGGTCVEGGRR